MSKKVIYLAGGCFWGVSEYFSRIDGVLFAVTGYANSDVKSPAYEEVKSGITGAAETVEVTYDSDKVALKTLLRQFFKIIDPVSLNKQGEDSGTQYRTGIFYFYDDDIATIDEVFADEQRKYEKKIVTEKGRLRNFYNAEDYHQEYLKKNPQGYCYIDFSSLNDLKEDKKQFVDPDKYQAPDRETLKTKLSAQAYEVTQHAATDPKFKGEHNDNFKKGIYVDPITGAPLFVSTDKYESGCGWPAFSKPIDDTVLSRHLDTSLNRQRIEVRSKTSNAHLGHVFTDGPKETGGLRYCINSAALRFIPFEELDEKGYWEFKKYVK